MTIEKLFESIRNSDHKTFLELIKDEKLVNAFCSMTVLDHQYLSDKNTNLVSPLTQTELKEIASRSTPLFMTVLYGNYDMFDDLINAGADTELKSGFMNTMSLDDFIPTFSGYYRFQAYDTVRRIANNKKHGTILPRKILKKVIYDSDVEALIHLAGSLVADHDQDKEISDKLSQMIAKGIHLKDYKASSLERALHEGNKTNVSLLLAAGLLPTEKHYYVAGQALQGKNKKMIDMIRPKDEEDLDRDDTVPDFIQNDNLSALQAALGVASERAKAFWLFHALKRGHIDSVKALLAAKIPIYADHFFAAGTYPYSKDLFKMLKDVKDKKCHPEHFKFNERLFDSIRRGDPDDFLKLIKNKDVINRYGYMVKADRKRLIHKNNNIPSQELEELADHCTPIFMTVLYGNYQMFKDLKDAGADVTLPAGENKDLNTFIIQFSGYERFLKTVPNALLDKYKNVYQHEIYHDEAEELIQSAKRGNIDSLKKCIEKDMQYRDYKGGALHGALVAGQQDCVQALLDADVPILDAHYYAAGLANARISESLFNKIKPKKYTRHDPSPLPDFITGAENLRALGVALARYPAPDPDEKARWLCVAIRKNRPNSVTLLLMSKTDIQAEHFYRAARLNATDETASRKYFKLLKEIKEGIVEINTLRLDDAHMQEVRAAVASTTNNAPRGRMTGPRCSIQ